MDSFHKKLILGIPFIRKFHAHLDFGSKTFFGAAQFDEIPLMDIEEFLVEAREGQVSMLFPNTEEDVLWVSSLSLICHYCTGLI